MEKTTHSFGIRVEHQSSRVSTPTDGRDSRQSSDLFSDTGASDLQNETAIKCDTDSEDEVCSVLLICMYLIPLSKSCILY